MLLSLALAHHMECHTREEAVLPATSLDVS